MDVRKGIHKKKKEKKNTTRYQRTFRSWLQESEIYWKHFKSDADLWKIDKSFVKLLGSKKVSIRIYILMLKNNRFGLNLEERNLRGCLKEIE